MKLEDYSKYYIQGSDHYLIPKYDFIGLFNEMVNWREEKKVLKKQLNYLRSGEYLNQLKFERNILQDIVENGKVSKEDKEFIDCTHRNTELLEQQREFDKYLVEKIEEALISVDKTPCYYAYQTIVDIQKKYIEIIGEKR